MVKSFNCSRGPQVGHRASANANDHLKFAVIYINRGSPLCGTLLVHVEYIAMEIQNDCLFAILRWMTLKIESYKFSWKALFMSIHLV